MVNERLKQLRLERGLNQIQLAEQLGVSKQCISNWENDNIQPSIEMLIKISNFFSISTDYILGLDDRKFIEITGLSDTQVSHIQLLINDLIKK